MKILLLILALLLGVSIAYMDSRPNWDDTGITAGCLLLATGILGFSSPRNAWVWALAVGMWIPLTAFIRTHDVRMSLILILAFAGAYGGSAIRRLGMRNRG
jgi:hypothetical protein